MDMCQESMESKQSGIDLKQSLEQLQNQNTLEEKITKLKKDLSKSESERDAAQQSLTVMSNRIQNTGEEQDRLTKTVQETRQLLEEKIFENAQLNMKLSEEMGNKKTLLEQYHTLCGHLGYYTTRNMKLEDEVQNLNGKSKKLTTLKCEHRFFPQRVQTAEQEYNETLQNTGEEQDRLTKIVEETKQLLEEKIIENAQLNMKLTDEKRNQQNLREEYHNLCGKLEEYTSRNVILEVEVQNLNEKSKKLTALENEYRFFLQRVQTAEQEYNETMELLQSIVVKAEMDQFETEKINKKLLKDLENMESANLCLSYVLEEANQDGKRLQDVIKRKEEEIQRRDSEIERFAEEYSKCWKAVQEKDIEVKALEQKNADFIGHQNHNQEVHYTQKLREEKQQIAEELSKQFSKIAYLKELIVSKGFNEELQKIEHTFKTKAY